MKEADILKLTKKLSFEPMVNALLSTIQTKLDELDLSIQITTSKKVMREMAATDKKEADRKEKEKKQEEKEREKKEKATERERKRKGPKPHARDETFCHCKNPNEKGGLLECSDAKACKGWVHFGCEGLDEEEYEENDEPYTCSACKAAAAPKRRKR